MWTQKRACAELVRGLLCSHSKAHIAGLQVECFCLPWAVPKKGGAHIDLGVDVGVGTAYLKQKQLDLQASSVRIGALSSQWRGVSSRPSRC